MADIDDKSSDVSIHDEATHDPVTTTVVGSKRGLDINVTNQDLIVGPGTSIRYDEMTNDQTIGTTYSNVYNSTTAGKVFSIYMRLEDINFDIKIIVDGTTIVDGINVADLKNNYKMDSGAFSQLPRFLYIIDGGKGVAFEFPNAAIFSTSFTIQLKHSTGSKNLVRGLVVRSED